MSLTEQDWLDAGYKKWNSKHVKSYSSYGLQKRVWTEDGKYVKYFLNVYAYDFREFKHQHPHASDWKDWTFSAEVRMFQSEDKSFDITPHGWETTRELEEWLENLYTTLHCIPDVDNN